MPIPLLTGYHLRYDSQTTPSAAPLELCCQVTKMQFTQRAGFLPWLALIIVWIVWGSTYLGMAAAVQTIPPFLMAGARFILAAPVLFLAAWSSFRKHGGVITPQQIAWAAGLGVLLFLGGNGLVSYAETELDSGLAALINALTPIWMTGMSTVVTRTPPTKRVMRAFVLAIIGVVVMVGTPGGDVPLFMAGVMLIASLCWAAGTVTARYVAMPQNPFVNSSIQMAGGGIALLLVAAVRGEFAAFAWDAVSRTSWLGFIWLFVAGSLVAYSAYVYANETLPIELLSTYSYVNPVIAVILGALLLSEPIGPNVIIGGGIILLAVIAIVAKRSRAKPIAETG